MVTPDQESLEIIKKENNLIKNAQLINSDFEFFLSGFSKPVDGVISGVYGSQRILNGKARSPHLGIDNAATIVRSNCNPKSEKTPTVIIVS